MTQPALANAPGYPSSEELARRVVAGGLSGGISSLLGGGGGLGGPGIGGSASSGAGSGNAYQGGSTTGNGNFNVNFGDGVSQGGGIPDLAWIAALALAGVLAWKST